MELDGALFRSNADEHSHQTGVSSPRRRPDENRQRAVPAYDPEDEWFD